MNRAPHRSFLPGRCQDPNQKMVAVGNAFSDIQCEDVPHGRKRPTSSLPLGGGFTQKQR